MVVNTAVDMEDLPAAVDMADSKEVMADSKEATAGNKEVMADNKEAMVVAHLATGHLKDLHRVQTLNYGNGSMLWMWTVRDILLLMNCVRLISGSPGKRSEADDVVNNAQNDWQNVFKHFDSDRSGSIDGSELSNALSQFGYNLNPQLLDLVQRKYDPRGTGQGTGRTTIVAPPAGISFDRFVRACVVIKQLSEAFKKLDNDKDGWIQINYDQFMHTVLTLP
ncbi:hypothetical protein V5O48_007859 [Marasmius crinis-equi]|uniref:EF-hand domain-containing protein n=1 Tax=Marasmius crinis-equi TaxID=585013 RepID=A0ABR3FFN9_9AGAR